MVAVKTDKGRKVIDGKVFKVYDEKQTDIPIASDRMMADILDFLERFAILGGYCFGKS